MHAFIMSNPLLNSNANVFVHILVIKDDNDIPESLSW